MRLVTGLLIGFSLLALGWATDSAAEAKLHIFYSGEVAGSFGPCGCAGHPAGGIARRIGFVKDFLRDSKIPSFQLDAGNYFAEPGPDASLVNRLMRESLTAIPISVLNLGNRDLYWWSELSGLQTEKLHFVSTNLEPRKPNLPRPPRYVILEQPVQLDSGVTRTIRIAVLGLCNPMAVKPNSGFVAKDPVEAVRSVLDEVTKQSDLVVVLWDLIRTQSATVPADSPLRAVAALSDRIALIITTERRAILYHPEKLNNATLLSGVERGRFIGDALLSFDRNGKLLSLKNEFHEMKEGVPEDPTWKAEQDRVSGQVKTDATS